METIAAIKDIEDYTTNNTRAKLDNEQVLTIFVNKLINTIGCPDKSTTAHEIDNAITKLRRIYSCNPSKSQMRYIYDKHYPNTPLNKTFGRYLIKKAMRSRSGVLVTTVVLQPSVFSCPKKCSYCPTETDREGRPTQPKSYLSTEPAMLRAIQYDFDVKGQIWDRIKAYINTGNIRESSGSVKMEVILSGGTWESYPYKYRDRVMNEIYWAANTYGDTTIRDMLDIKKEIEINETAKFRVIGMTIETRPDFITKKSIKDYCRWGVTRVQIGVQHYDDDILVGINRDCNTEDTIRAIKMLKQSGFKIVCHLMPDLPGSSLERDKWMFDQAINNPDLQFDDVKVYPTAVCQSANPNRIVKSDIADWYAQGLYTPYAETDLNDLIWVLKYYKTNIQPWVRIQRLVRDIPKQSIQAGYERISNLRQVIQDQMKKEGTKCNCIRCMEIGDDDKLMDSAKLVVRPYIASGGQEYHISIESNTKSSIWSLDYWSYVWFLITYWILMIFTNQKTYWGGNIKTYNGLVGFCRFRIDPHPGGGFIKVLKDCALIREVHVYGHSLGVGSLGASSGPSLSASSQHKGYGQLLVKTAEEIAIANGYKKIAVIAGVGTREYYKNKCGYHKEGTYMIKHLNTDNAGYNKYIKMTSKSGLFCIFNILIIFISGLYYLLI